MNITIVQDCSPYYMIIEHSDQTEIFNKTQQIIDKNIFKFIRSTTDSKFFNFRLHHQDTAVLFQISPINLLRNQCQLSFSSIYKTLPGCQYPIHRDGSNTTGYIRYSLNYMISVHDDLCLTSWFSPEITDQLQQVSYRPGNTHIAKLNDTKIEPATSACFKQGQCVLLNTDLFHSFDNSRSEHERIVLTLRWACPQTIMFQDVANKFKQHQNQ